MDKLLGERANKNKAKLSMLLDAAQALDGAAQVLMFGEKKYARGNWLRGLPLTEIMDSMLRHTVAFNGGEDVDPESDLPHVDHILVNALFLAEMYRHSGTDDRTVNRQADPKAIMVTTNPVRPWGEGLVRNVMSRETREFED